MRAIATLCTILLSVVAGAVLAALVQKEDAALGPHVIVPVKAPPAPQREAPPAPVPSPALEAPAPTESGAVPAAPAARVEPAASSPPQAAVIPVPTTAGPGGEAARGPIQPVVVPGLTLEAPPPGLPSQRGPARTGLPPAAGQR